MSLIGDSNGNGADSQSANCGGGSAADVVYQVTRSEPGTITASLAGNFNKVLYVRDGCNTADLACDAPGQNTPATVPSQSYALGTDFFYWVDGQSGATGPYKLSLTP